MSLNGGYAMIKHNATQQELAVAYKTKKPVLLYDENFKAHWAQINEKEVETVDEETHETITTYEYSYELLNAIEALVDSAGNHRFIEGKGQAQTIAGVTITYNKWSLSGTHLMIVLCGTLANGTTTGNVLAKYFLPKWIMDKIVPIFSNRVSNLNVTAYDNSYGGQNITMFLNKLTDNIDLGTTSVTMTANRNFRVQFDLLIDNE